MNDTPKRDDEYKPQPPNLDLIQMVQNARMMHDREVKPSESASNYWIESKPLQGNIPAPTARAGQWVIETTASAVDEQWEIIKTATENGELGYKSKVSTSAREGRDSRVIYVRTYDADDLPDVQRVHKALQALGFQPKRYERD